ncbi:MAG: hypothetical protein ISS26_00860 [Candidatus Omnitrophica bacterium]|nr:hypothetical protein [Candidatus Omnitrophota bacterium]
MRKRQSLHDKAFKALKEAIREVIKRHKETGRSLAIWQNDKLIHMSAREALRKNGKQ